MATHRFASQASTARAALSAAQLEPLRPHAVNLRFGTFSNSGTFTTTAADVDRIFSEHLPAYVAAQQDAGRPAHLLFYAHGGLVDENGGLALALDHLAFHKANHVYPIFFIWETGLLESIADMLRGQLPLTRNLVTDLTDRLIEGLSREGGLRIWGHMKRSAETSVLQGGGALHVAERAAAFCREHAALQVHAVGHSAGAIFHSHFVPSLLQHGVPNVHTVQLLAPAVNLPTFKQKLLPEVNSGRVDHLRMFTMRRALEVDDSAGPYRKSLLYLVHHAFEDPDETGILGLEENLQADADAARFFGVGGSAPHASAALVFSKSDAGALPDRASQSTTHGGFDNDAATMNSVIRTLLAVDAGTAIAPFEQHSTSRALQPDDPLERLSRELQASSAPALPIAPKPGKGIGFGAVNAAAFGTPAVLPPRVPSSTSSHPTQQPVLPAGARRRRALCVGIDNYPTAPLRGCLNDSRTWQSALRGLGFTVDAIPEGEATRAGLTEALRSAIQQTRPGDSFVFQFAGHGIRIEDDGNADEPVDEAFVPLDFATHGFLRDDEIRAMLDSLPPGVNATLIIDCCHSGGLPRFRPGSDERPREIAMTPELLEVHRRTRVATPRARNLAGMPRRDWWLMACQPAELAWESGGQGDFTRIVSPLFAAGMAPVSYAALQAQIDELFKTNTRQHPMLDCDGIGKTVSLFEAAAAALV